ncbi:MAG: BLUF domain-containing protein [Steroidobacteraceae bacterium]
MSDLFELIYTSRLATDAPPSCVADIVRNARSYNRLHDITGLLVFDGERFLQYLEGPQSAVTRLVKRIETDPRHVEFKTIHQGLITRHRFSAWSMAYALDEEGEMLNLFSETHGADPALMLEMHLSELDFDNPASTS